MNTTMIRLIVVLMLWLSSNQATGIAEGHKIVIDHDGGADDAMAIFIALLYQEHFQGPPVVGLTTANGNVNESQVFSNSQRILGIANRRDVPIYRGSASSIIYTYPTDFYFGYDGLGDLENVSYQAIEAQHEHAALALIDLSKKYEGELIVVALAALTNIALAIKLDPQFISRLAHLYVGAGTVHSAAELEPEFNAQIDVEAYYIVAENSTPDKVTIVPFSQIKTSLNVTREWRENVLGAIPTEIMKAQNDFERLSIVQSDSWVMLDPAVMSIVLKQNLVEETKYSQNSIILCGDERGINTNNFDEVAKANVRAVFAANEELYKLLLLDVFSSES